MADGRGNVAGVGQAAVEAAGIGGVSRGGARDAKRRSPRRPYRLTLRSWRLSEKRFFLRTPAGFLRSSAIRLPTADIDLEKGVSRGGAEIAKKNS